MPHKSPFSVQFSGVSDNHRIVQPQCILEHFHYSGKKPYAHSSRFSFSLNPPALGNHHLLLSP